MKKIKFVSVIIYYMYVGMYVCMQVCMGECMYVCMYVFFFFLINFISQHVPLQKQYYMLGIAYI